MTRRSLTKLQRVRVFDAAGGICHLCQTKIHVGERWEVEHVKPLSMNGADDEGNMAPAHVSCHRVKTSAEAGPRAKADRARARHLGIRPKSKFPCSRDSKFKKTLDGRVILR
jgi:5-methylcytosine-specific restriction protein A